MYNYILVFCSLTDRLTENNIMGNGAPSLRVKLLITIQVYIKKNNQEYRDRTIDINFSTKFYEIIYPRINTRNKEERTDLKFDEKSSSSSFLSIANCKV